MQSSWGKYSHANCQVYPDDTESQSENKTKHTAVPQLGLNKENHDSGKLQWRIFEDFFMDLHSYSNGGVAIEEFVKRISKLNVFATEADAFIFLKKFDLGAFSGSQIYLKQMQTSYENGNGSIRRITSVLVKSVCAEAIPKILECNNERSTPRISSVESSVSDMSTSRSTSSQPTTGRRNSGPSPYKYHNLTPRNIAAKGLRKERTRDKVFNRMLTRAYESLSNINTDDIGVNSTTSPREGERRRSFGQLTSYSSNSDKVDSVDKLNFTQRITIEQYLTSRGR